MANMNTSTTTLAVRGPPVAANGTQKGPARKDRAMKKKNVEKKAKRDAADVHHMSPYFNTLIPTVLNQGRAFPYTGITRLDITQGVNDTIILAATNNGISGSVFTLGFQSGAGLPAYAVYTIPTLALADTVGGPTSGRAMKFSMGLCCTTPLLSRGGRVTTLNGQSRIRIDNAPSAVSLATFNNIVATVRATPASQAHDASDFGHEQQMSGSVVDSVTYEDYEEWVGTESVDEFWEHIAVWVGSVRRDRPMSTAWIVLSPPAVQQTFTISCRASYYTRWGLSTVPGQSQFDVPTAPASFINRVQAFASGMADTLHTIADIGAVTTQFLPPLMNAAEYVAPRAAMLAIAA